MLWGRDRERRTLESLIDGLHHGRGGSLAVLGEPGVGKTALLESVIDDAAEKVVVLRAVGVESEMEMPYSTVQQLVSPYLSGIDELPPPQADALGAAVGLRSSAPPDRFLVALGVLTLLAGLADQQPVLCFVDDAQWIDLSSLAALSFAARRVAADPMAFVFTSREASSELRGLPELRLAGLEPSAARALLASVVPERLDEGVAERIVAETGGNPLALLELHRGTAPGGLAGGFGLPSANDLTDRLEDTFLGRARALPDGAQLLLLLAASEPLGDPGLFSKAATDLGLSLADAAPAEADGLLRIGTRVTFRHPLVRSAVYKSAPADDRRQAHRSLANMTDSSTDPDRRAWHLAQATYGHDDEVADDLERSAQRARSRGGPTAEGAFLRAAAALSTDPARSAQFRLRSAEAYHVAGVATLAQDALDQVDATMLSGRERIRYDQVRSRLLLGDRRDARAPRLMLAAARQLEALDARAARDAYLDAYMGAIIVGPAAMRETWFDLHRAVGGAPMPPRREAADDLLDGLAAVVNDGYAQAVPFLRIALGALQAEETAGGQGLAVLWLGARAAMNLWDDVRFASLSHRLVSVAREQGLIGALPSALSSLTAVALLIGDFARAAAMIAEAETLTTRRVGAGTFHGSMALAAWQGREEAYNVTSSVAGAFDVPGSGGALAVVTAYTEALLYNGLGRYEQALPPARLGAEHAGDLGYALWALPELVEAASRCDESSVARTATEMLAATTGPADTHWSRGIEARCRALCLDGDAAEVSYRTSLHELAQTRFATQLARTHLVYGEWLRRQRRRLDARGQLRRAQELFAGIGARAFAARAERELAATGERARPRNGGSATGLTPQETQVARLAAEGHANAEIAARLFISSRTVEYHLHKVFIKLDITSRNQLNRALGSSPRTSSSQS